jgi:hypothetical protein
VFVREPAKIVEPEHVIGVGVRDEHRVEPIEVRREGLRPEVRAAIEEKTASVGGGKEGARPPAAVARVGRDADRAATTKARHAERRAGSEEANFHDGARGPKSARAKGLRIRPA